MPVPEQNIPQKPNQFRDKAFRCFGFISLFFIIATIAAMLPLDNTTYQVLGMVVGIPATLLFMAAGASGVLISLIYARERALLIMSGCFIMLCALFALSESQPLLQVEYYAALIDTLSVINAVLIIALSTHHFFIIKKSKNN